MLKIPNGIISKLWFEFPRGCAGLAGVQLWRGPYQLFPLPEGVWLRSDNSILNFNFSHAVTEEPFEIEIRGYNVDTIFVHTLWIGIEMHGSGKTVSQLLIDLLTLWRKL